MAPAGRPIRRVGHVVEGRLQLAPLRLERARGRHGAARRWARRTRRGPREGCGTTKASHDRSTWHGAAPRADRHHRGAGHPRQHDGAVLGDVARPPRPVGHDQHVLARVLRSAGRATGARAAPPRGRATNDPDPESLDKSTQDLAVPGAARQGVDRVRRAVEIAGRGGSARARPCRSRALRRPRALERRGRDSRCEGSRRGRGPPPGRARPRAARPSARRRRRRPAAGPGPRAGSAAGRPIALSQNGPGRAQPGASLAQTDPDLEQAARAGRRGPRRPRGGASAAAATEPGWPGAG